MDNTDFLSLDSAPEFSPPQKIKVNDLDFYSLLRRQGSDGKLFFNRRRAVLFDVGAMGALRQQLVETLGQDMAMGVLLRFGQTQGHHDAEMLGQTFDWASDTDWLMAGFALHTMEGLVHVDLKEVEFDRAAGDFYMQGVWRNSYEAEEHIKRYGLADRSVCWFLTGYASGYASHFFGRELLAVETSCVAKGDKHCTWEIRPVKQWGPEIELYRRALQQIGGSNQLLESNRQIQAQAHSLVLLNELGVELNAATTVEDILKISAAKLKRLFPKDFSSVALSSPTLDKFDLFELKSQTPEIPVETLVSATNTAIGCAIQENRTIVIANPQDSNYVDSGKMAQQGALSVFVTPLFTRGRVIGTLNLSRQTANLFDAREQTLALQVASLLAATIENRRLLEQAEINNSNLLQKLHLDSAKNEATPNNAEDALQESRTLYQSSLDGMPQSVYRINREGHIIFGNKAYLTALGMSLEACLGKTAYDFFPKELADKYTVDDQQVIQTGEDFNIVERHRVPVTGEVTYVQTVKTPVRNANGDIMGVQGIFWDVTQQKQAELALTKRATELETVAEVSVATATILDVQPLLQTVVDLTKSNFGLYHAHIYLLDESENMLNLAVGAGEVGRKMESRKWRIALNKKDSIVAQAARTQKGVIANDVQSSPDFLPNPLLPDTRSELAVPLIAGRHVLGVLDVQAGEVNHFTDEDVRIQTTLASQVAVALQNANLYQQTQTTLQEVEILYNAGRQISETDDLQEIVTAIAKTGYANVIDRVVLINFAYNAANTLDDVVVSAVWHNGDVPYDPVGTRYPKSVFNSIKLFLGPEPLFFDDIQQDQRVTPVTLEFLQEFNIRAMAVLPLFAGADQIGALWLESVKPYHFTERQSTPYISLASRVAVAIEKQRLLQETSTALAEVEATQRRYTVQSWEAYQARTPLQRYQNVREGEPLSNVSLPPEVEIAVGQKQTAVTSPSTFSANKQPAIENSHISLEDKSSNLVVPLTVRGQVIGVLGVQETDTARNWSAEEISVVEAIASQMAQAAENLRLLDETQQRAARERRVNEIGDKIQSAQSLKEALQIAVKEVGLSLETPQTTVKLDVE